MSDGPKRHRTDPYLPMPEEVVRQLRQSGVPSVETVVEMLDAQEGPQSQDETLVPCMECEHCIPCGGTHMVSARIRVEQERLKTERPEDPAK